MTSRFLKRMVKELKKRKVVPIPMYGLNWENGCIFFGADYKPPLWNSVVVSKVVTGKERRGLMRSIPSFETKKNKDIGRKR